MGLPFVHGVTVAQAQNPGAFAPSTPPPQQTGFSPSVSGLPNPDFGNFTPSYQAPPASVPVPPQYDSSNYGDDPNTGLPLDFGSPNFMPGFSSSTGYDSITDALNAQGVPLDVQAQLQALLIQSGYTGS